MANAAAPRSAPSPAARRAWQWLGLPALCLLSTLLLLNNEVLPLGAVRAEDLASDYGLLTWNLWATTESALRGESPYHTRLLYHPLGANLAVHTLGPGFAPLGILMRAVLGGRSDYPLYAHRLAIVVCFALGMLLAYRALCAMGASAPAAVAGGVGWAFAACWRLIVANQTLSAACFLLPAVTLGVVAFVRRPSTVRLAVLALLVGAGVYFSEYFAVFIAAAVLVVALAATTSSGTRAVLSRCAAAVGIKGAALAIAVGALAVGPFLWAWSSADARPPKTRQIFAGGANLAGFVVPDPSLTPLYRGGFAAALHARVSRGRAPFLGGPTILLGAVALVAARGRRTILLAVASVFLILSLGPSLKVFGTQTGFPLPYATLMRVPPFQMARDPQRLAIVGIWPLVCLAALGLTTLAGSLARRWGRAWGQVAVLIVTGWWAAEGWSSGHEPATFVPPAALARIAPGAVVDVPLSLGDGLSMFLQVFHRRPIVSGYVSRVSLRQFEYISELQRLLDDDVPAFVRRMRAVGVNTVVLEPGMPEVIAAPLMSSGLAVVDLRAGVVGAASVATAGWRRAPGVSRARPGGPSS